jgi:hypothetical protein
MVKKSKMKYLWQFRVHQNGTHDHPVVCTPYTVFFVESTVTKNRRIEVNGIDKPLDASSLNFADSPLVLMTQPVVVYLLKDKNNS